MEVMNMKHTIDPAEEDEKVLKQPRFLSKTCEMTENSMFYSADTNCYQSIELKKIECADIEIMEGILDAHSNAVN